MTTDAAPAPAPAATPGTDLSTGCQTCPRTAPCDVDALEIVATRGLVPAGTPPGARQRKLSTTRARRGTRLTAELRRAHRQLADFDEYDLIIEILGASQGAGGTVPPDRAITLEARAEWIHACPDARRHTLTLESRGRGRESRVGDTPASRPVAEVKRENVNGPPTANLALAGPTSSALQLMFGVFELAYSVTRESIRWVARADSCAIRTATRIEPLSARAAEVPPPERRLGGRPVAVQRRMEREAQVAAERRRDEEERARAAREAAAESGPRGELRGVFIVMAEMKATVKVTLPPGRARHGQHLRGYDLTGGHDYTRSTDRFRNAQLEQFGTRPRPIEDVRQAWSAAERRGADGAPLAEVNGGPRPAQATPQTALGPASDGLKIEVTLNERTIDCTAHVQQLRALITGFEATVDAFKDVLKAIPQVGLRFDYAVEFLSGTVEGGIELRERQRPVADRLLPVERVGFIKGQLVLVRIALEASFGFLVERPSLGVRVEARIAISIGGSLGGELDVEVPDGRTTGKINATAPIRVSGTAMIRVTSVVQAEVTVAATTALKAEATVYDPDDGFVFRGKALLEKTVGTFTWKWGLAAGSSQGDLFDEYEIAKFGSSANAS